MAGKEQPDLDGLVSEEEREHLLSELHRFLVWVGEPLPDTVDLDGEVIELRDLIWSCIHEKQISEKEKELFMELIRALEKKEKYDLEALQRSDLTREEAKKLYHEAASLIRAIMDLRECEEGNIELKGPRDEVRQKIDDAKRWLDFLKGIGKNRI